MTMFPSPESHIPTARVATAPENHSGAIWCSWCETKERRPLSALHRCPVCGRRCCGEVTTPTRREVLEVMSPLPQSQRVWDPEAADARRQYESALERWRQAATRRGARPPVG